MSSKLTVVAVLAVFAAAPGLASDKSDGNGQAAQPQEKVICHTEAVTGSRISKRRICMTKAEWDQLAQSSKDKIDNFTSRQSGVPGSGSNPAAPQ